MFVTDEDMTKEEFYEKHFEGRVSWDDFMSIYSWGYDDGYDDGYDQGYVQGCQDSANDF